MKIIEINGNADKKLLVYIMAKCLSVENKVCIVSDDITYRRLLRGNQADVEDGCVTGSISDVDVIIKTGLAGEVRVEDIVKNISENLDKRLSNLDRQYDYVIVPCELIECTNADKRVECIQIDRAFEKEEEELIKFEDDSEVLEQTDGNFKLRLTVNKPKLLKKDKNKEVGVEKAVLYGSSLEYVYTCEEYKRLLIYRDKGIMSAFSKIIAACSGYDVKYIEKLIGMDDGEKLSKQGRQGK